MSLRPSQRWIKIAAGCTVCAAAAGLSWEIVRRGSVAPATSAPADEPVAVPVRTISLRAGHLAQTFRCYGVVRPRPDKVWGVAAPFDAVVLNVHVAPGEPVALGVIIAEVGPTPETQLLFRQAEDALRAATRNAAEARRRRDAQLATNADVTAAEQAETAARTQFDALKVRGVGAAHPLIATAAGTVAAVNAQPGQTAPAGTVLVTVTPDDALEARVGVDPEVAATLTVGQAAALRDVAAADGVPPLAGVVRRVARAIDPQSRLVDVLVTLPPAAAWVDGTFVESTFVAAVADGWIVPRDATARDGDDWVLFCVRDGHAVRHVVRLGPAADGQVQVIADDLHAGDAVVIAHNGDLADAVAVINDANDPDDKTDATRPADAKGGA